MEFKIIFAFASLAFGAFMLPHQVQAQGTHASCPRWKQLFPRCLCFGAVDENGEQIHQPIVDCSSLGLSTVPVPSQGITDGDNLYEFRLKNNSLTQLGFNAFHGIRIQRVDLTGNSIEQLDNNAFTEVASSLKVLHIEGDSTGLPQTEALGKLLELEELTMINYRVDDLPHLQQGLFGAFTKLQTLTLDNWGLETVKPHAFQNGNNQPTIINLNLINQKLPTLPLDALNSIDLKQLRKLHISNSLISEVSSHAFDNLDFIEEINLSHNKIKKIDSNSFISVGGTLKNLDLSHNQLGVNGTNDLLHIENSVRLEKLTLRNNELPSVPKMPNIGKDVRASVLTIDLSNNKIASLSNEDIAHYSKRLSGLNVAENNIDTISDQTFNLATVLSSLDVSFQNGISNVPLRLPNSLTQAANHLTFLDFSGQDVDEANLWQTINQLKNLETLKVHSAGLTKVDDSSFQYMNKLKDLDLSFNRISKLTDLTLVGARQLKKLNLRNNNIRVIPSCLFHQIQPKITIDLESNPFDCSAQNGCDNKKFLENIQNGVVTFQDNNSVPVCSGTGLKITLIDPSTLSCDQIKQCQDAPTSTEPPSTAQTTTATDGIRYILSIQVSDVGTTSLRVSWNLSNMTGFQRFVLRIEALEISQPQIIEEDNLSTTNFDVTTLKPNVLYQICVTAFFNTNQPIRKCENQRTDADPTSSPRGGSDSDSASVEVIVGCVVGAVLLLLVIAAIVYILVIRRKPKKKYETTAPTQPRQFTKAELPTMNGDSRSFVKVKKNGDPGPKHEGMQVVAISDGQNRPSQKGRVGRANLMSTDGTYKTMDKTADSKRVSDVVDYEPMQKPFRSMSTQGNDNQAYENDHGSLPPTPGLPPSSPRGTHGYYNEAFTGEPSRYDEITI